MCNGRGEATLHLLGACLAKVIVVGVKERPPLGVADRAVGEAEDIVHAYELDTRAAADESRQRCEVLAAPGRGRVFAEVRDDSLALGFPNNKLSQVDIIADAEDWRLTDEDDVRARRKDLVSEDLEIAGKRAGGAGIPAAQWIRGSLQRLSLDPDWPEAALPRCTNVAPKKKARRA